MAEGFKDFTALDILTAAQVDDYLMRQSVMRFASAAARNSALSGVIVEGMVAFLKDTNTLTAYDGTSWWTVGAATNTLTTGATFVSQVFTVTHTVNYSKYQIANGICEWWFQLTMTSDPASAGTAFYTNLPVTSDTDALPIGEGYVFDSSAGTFDMGMWQIPAANATRIQFLCDRSTSGYWGATPSLSLGVSDLLAGHVRFPVDAAA
jgi:hypothetical protein